MQAIAEGLFTGEEPPRLIGGRNCQTGRIVFPCPTSGDFEPVALGRTGKLWSWTIQCYRPKTPPYAGPEAFEPWALGYVELPGETIVEARIVDFDASELAIGMMLELTCVALDPAADDPKLIPAFRPLEARS